MFRSTCLAAMAMTAFSLSDVAAQANHDMPMPGGQTAPGDSASAASGMSMMESMHDRMQSMHDMMQQGHGAQNGRSSSAMGGMGGGMGGATAARTCVASGPEAGVSALLVGAVGELGLTDDQEGEIEALLARTRADALAVLSDEQRAKLMLAESLDAPCTSFESGGGGMGGMAGMGGGGMGGGGMSGGHGGGNGGGMAGNGGMDGGGSMGGGGGHAGH